MLCTWCNEFTPKHPRGRYCSGRCRVAAWHARCKRRDPQQEQRLQDLVRLLAKEVGLAPEDFA
jgi:hypothetical protein